MSDQSVSLPSIFGAGGLEVRRELVGGSHVRDVVVINGGHSTRDTHVAIARARRDLAHLPENIANVDVRVDRHAVAQLEAAKRKRERRAAKARGA